MMMMVMMMMIGPSNLIDNMSQVLTRMLSFTINLQVLSVFTASFSVLMCFQGPRQCCHPEGCNARFLLQVQSKRRP